MYTKVTFFCDNIYAPGILGEECVETLKVYWGLFIVLLYLWPQT